MLNFRGTPAWERIDKSVLSRYNVHNRIGRGCYGVVWEASFCQGDKLLEDSSLFAMKKIVYAFRNATDAQRTYREVAYLTKFGSHENILRLRDVMLSPSRKHVYLITDEWECDLQKAIKCRSLQPVHRPLIAYQVFRALKFLHSASVMHRDVKPSNILLNTFGDVVLADFGWARSSPERLVISLECAPLTEYASTRWYRAPEMLLGGRMYTTAIDIWAAACVVGEMQIEEGFIPGTSTLDMITRIEELLGKPFAHDIEAMEAPYGGLVFEVVPAGPPNKPVAWHLKQRGQRKGTPSEELVDFLELLLQYNPKKRMLAAEALSHPYLGGFHNPDDEPEFGSKVELDIPDDELASIGAYRDEIRVVERGGVPLPSMVATKWLARIAETLAPEEREDGAPSDTSDAER